MPGWRGEGIAKSAYLDLSSLVIESRVSRASCCCCAMTSYERETADTPSRAQDSFRIGDLHPHGRMGQFARDARSQSGVDRWATKRGLGGREGWKGPCVGCAGQKKRSRRSRRSVARTGCFSRTGDGKTVTMSSGSGGRRL